MRLATSLIALLIALFGALPAAYAAPSTDPKVVLVVGPAGEATDRYRERAEAAARIAERYTSNVVRLYSPNATWPAVREALDGAAVVVYLGHGNGWPSRYRDSPYGGTQNGFGLNPVAGGGDDAHQYFGEDLIAADIKLARNAVVLLHHLCYASGNTEPGLPEGTVDQAKQRVANYAAGFIKAGAGAVVAEGHMGPAWYMQQLLGGRRTIDRIWRASPNAHGNEFRFESPRSPGFVAAMDPDHGDSGFYRSIVYRGGVGGGRLAGSDAAAVIPAPTEPTLVGAGLEIRTPYLKAPPVAGTKARLWFPYLVKDAEAIEGLQVGVRWDPVDVAEGGPPAAETPAEPVVEVVEPPATEGTTPADGASDVGRSVPAVPSVPTQEPGSARTAPAPSVPAGRAEPGASEAPAASDTPAATPEPAGSEDPAPPPDPAAGRVTYIQAERVGDLVEPVAAIVGPKRIVVDVELPVKPGRYRLVATLHDREKVAFDAATQTLVGAMLVDVAGAHDARYLVAPAITVKADRAFELPVGVGNVGARAWGQVGAGVRASREERAIAASLAGHWIALDGDAAEPAPPAAVQLEPGLPAGAVERTTLSLTAPARAGSYLLVLDVRLPGLGSLAANGSEPALVRVTVE